MLLRLKTFLMTLRTFRMTIYSFQPLQFLCSLTNNIKSSSLWQGEPVFDRVKDRQTEIQLRFVMLPDKHCPIEPHCWSCRNSLVFTVATQLTTAAVIRIWTGVAAATTQSANYDVRATMLNRMPPCCNCSFWAVNISNRLLFTLHGSSKWCLPSRRACALLWKYG